MKTLRPYQAAAIEAIRAALQHHKSTVVVLPTGLGKTIVAAKLIAEWGRGNCLFLAHTRELIDQAADKLTPELGFRPGVEMNIETVEPRTLWNSSLTVVGSVQTMYGAHRLAKYKSRPFDLIVVDECHHAISSSYQRIISFFRALNPELKVVGITATPRRADGAALGMLFESVAYQMSIREAIADGWLVPIDQEFLVVEALSFEGLRTKKNEFGETDFNAKDLEQILLQEDALHRMARPTLEKLQGRPAIVFTASVRQAHELANMLNRYQPGSAAAVDGGMDGQRRREVVRDFTSERLQIVCNCAVFTEGFDAPNCSAIVMARPTRSLALYTQMLGRGLRPLPGLVDGRTGAEERRLAIRTSAKPACLVIDFVGNSSHKLPTALDVLGGHHNVEIREQAKQEAQRERKDVCELLEQTAALVALEQEWQERQRSHIRAQEVGYSTHAVDPFDPNAAAPVCGGQMGPKRGSATDRQVDRLVSLGVPRERAERFSKPQAGKVIDRLTKTRCTVKQEATLRKHGIDPSGMSKDRASRIISAIAANGWQRPEELPE